MSTTGQDRQVGAREGSTPAEPEEWQTGPAAWGARPLRPSSGGFDLVFLVEAAAVVVVVAIVLTTMQRALATLLTLIVGMAVLALHTAWRAHRRRRAPDELERRVLTQDVYGLKALFVGGEAVDELTRGTRFVIGQNPTGHVCLYAYGREYPLSSSELYRVRQASAPVQTTDRSRHGGA